MSADQGPGPNVLLAAGEVSGDMAASRLARCLLQLLPGVDLFGLGGERLAAAGVEIVHPTDHLGAVGVSEALAVAPALVRAFAALRRRVLAHLPDVAVLIGNDVFNTLLARWLRRHGVPTVAFFPPQAWMWGAIGGPVARSYDLLLACFPHELERYSRVRGGGRVVFVGHFLADELAVRSAEEVLASRASLALAERSPVVGLLPGSRSEELTAHLDVLLGAARELGSRYPAVGFAIPVALEAFRPRVEAAVAGLGLDGRVVLTRDSHEVMRASDALVVASGTATLEAALLGVPLVIVLRVHRLSALVARAAVRLRLLDSETVGLPNLVLGRAAVAELRQERVTVENVVREVGAILDDERRAEAAREALALVRQRIAGGGSIERATREVAMMIESRRRQRK